MAIEKKWIVKEQGNPATVRALSAELGIDQVLANLLVQRNITTAERAREFFKPDLSKLHDPFLMKDMDKAVQRLIDAISSEEKVLIYGDYDVDGTTAVALMYTFIRNFNPNVEYYIPDRYDEGYGISYKGIDWGHENGYTLIIALDCGIKAVEKVAYAKSLGIDIIICDHHLPDEELPAAAAILDPKRNDCNYPFDDLSGCGVGFKLIQAYAIRKSLPFAWVESFLDLVAVSIAADLVSMTGENRILAYYGLERLNHSPRKGLQSIIKLSGLENHKITVDDIVFKIGPRINAAGRMESGRTAVHLLVSRNDDEAQSIGKIIDLHNKERKSVDKQITKAAIESVMNDRHFMDRKSTVVFDPKWNKGVVAIVASRLVEAFYRPTIVLTESNGLITGSARSIAGFDLYEAIKECSEYLENYGGHMYAAGLTLKKENLLPFEEKFEKVVAEKITEDILTPVVQIDTYLDFKQITPKFFRILKQFQPFGPGNQSPVFITENVYDNGNGRLVGSGNGHMKLELIQEDEPYRYISAIAFNRSEHFEHLHAGNPVDICYSIAENYYRGIANIQLRVKDIHKKELF
ncbi:MAG TPA: single-stranded-DNA-specific exonuclease RecJ [Candidatus Coprenecus stercoravium]|uniref:Single-stranded-DNA-specific exonuclease RecJ n=1 Tax=Candidatus Coprenecus stercoravium TaxID=2840735 RepID=A0A9D2GPY7_9BACT|nr:single-stranded-DNA-specific exonuclease RecJ [Candidatus Coprenecus stercoravium]